MRRPSLLATMQTHGSGDATRSNFFSHMATSVETTSRGRYLTRHDYKSAFRVVVCIQLASRNYNRAWVIVDHLRIRLLVHLREYHEPDLRIRLLVHSV